MKLIHHNIKLRRIKAGEYEWNGYRVQRRKWELPCCINWYLYNPKGEEIAELETLDDARWELGWLVAEGEIEAA